MKVFNTAAVCIPSKHYMVDLSERVAEIKKLVDAGKYFTINRARQYGKTTTLMELQKYLMADYEVVSLSFEGISHASFDSEQAFVKAFSRKLKRESRNGLTLPEEIQTQIEDYISRKTEKANLDELFDTLLDWCAVAEKQIVLIIDEVDSAANNYVFLDFLAGLRDSYISRDTKGIKTFQSVILAGVVDIKHIRSKLRKDADVQENSPWNIAADFTIDMSLSTDGIKGMLDEYELEHHAGMDTEAMARQLREYTNGYPFLVSRICQLIDEHVSKVMHPAKAWSMRGMDEAIKLLLAENNTLFQSLTKNLNNHLELKTSIRSILMEGTKIAYNAQQDDIVRMQMYGLIKNDHNAVRISNRIFEMMLYNLFLTEEELRHNMFSRRGDLARNQFVENGKLNMELILQRFAETYREVFGPLKEKFKEKDGRELFLLYLKPIINGTGYYYIEAQTRNQLRTDVIIDYLGQQYIVELKIWRGERYHTDGEKQVLEYLEYFGLTTGYMLSFNFNKKKESGLRRVPLGDKLLIECTL